MKTTLPLRQEELEVYRKANALKSRLWRRNNLEKARAIEKKWRTSNPEKKATSTKKWMEENKEVWKDYMKRWREANKDRIKVYNRTYKKKNRARVSAVEMVRQERNSYRTTLQHKVFTANKKYRGKLSIHDVVEIVEREKNTCYWCGKKDLEGRDLTLEHLKRVNKKEYIVLACFSCNASRISPSARISNKWGRTK